MIDATAQTGALTLRNRRRAFGGQLDYYSHDSVVCGGPMNFALFRPLAAADRRLPALYYLSGLTCTEENMLAKGGALPLAASLGLMLVAPDTSPRGRDLPGEDASWDFGAGAGFYVDATREPWSGSYHMFSYVTDELPALVHRELGGDARRQGVFGHSMGGHGALVAALRCPGTYRSVSAFAPICAPSRCPWGVKAFSGYIGEDREAWARYDACQLLADGHRAPGTILVDQGGADEFLAEQLNPHLLAEACAAADQPLDLRLRRGYDHSYYFVASFMAEHLEFHARALGC